MQNEKSATNDQNELKEEVSVLGSSAVMDQDELFFNHVIEGYLAVYKVPGTVRQL